MERRLFSSDTIYSFLRFIVTAVLSASINIGGTAFLHEIVGFGEELAFGIIIVFVFFINFFMMRYYVCRSSEGALQRQILFFLFSSLVFRGLEYFSFLLIHSVIGVQYLFAIISILGVSFVIKFVYYRSVVFINKE